MKPTAIPHQIRLAAWRQPKTKDAILDRIETITRELEAIQAEMNSQLTGPTFKRNSIFCEDRRALQVLGRFKAELDHSRRVLWFHIEQAAQEPAGRIDTGQARRLERVTGLLSALSPQPGIAMSGGEQSGSFFERLNVVIDTYMQEKKPVAAETKAASPAQAKASS
jgi:hypothetical protein